MRIAISTSVVQRGKSGVGQYVLALTRAMLAQGHGHEFVLLVLEGDLPLFQFARGEARLVSVPEKLRPAVANIWWHQSVLPGLVKRHGVQVLHVPSYRRLLWPKPCRLVGTIHDLASFSVPGKYDWKRMLYARFVVKRLARRQDELVAISENTAADVQRFFGIPRSRLHVIHNGLDHQRFRPGSGAQAKSSFRSKYGLAKPFFLYIARLEHPGKNHVRVIAAFEQFKAATGSEWQLVFGGSDWHGAETVHAAIRRSPCVADIKCLGFVPDDQLPELYQAADIFLYPSLYEGFGLPPVEAMACGCPVICSARGALGEVVGEAAAIVEPEDVGSMAREMRIVATDADRAEQLRSAGFLQARRFDWNRTAQQMLRVFEGRTAEPCAALAC
jgi:glycosyltransferase involved in cell wall biosynthesis